MIVRISNEEKNKCFEFSKSIIEAENQFNRFRKNKDYQIVRTYVGKLAEYVFLHFLHSNEIQYDIGDMFKIYEGEENTDSYDFITPDGATIDIKTASLPYHSRIMVPISQFHLKKDFYVGIKLNFKTDKIQPMDIDSCRIYGYIERLILKKQPTEFFGEANCKAYPLKKLKFGSQFF